jgi:hypothetical protein
MITLPYSPLARPPGLTAVPGWILPTLAAFYIIASEGPHQDFSSPLATGQVSRAAGPISV